MSPPPEKINDKKNISPKKLDGDDINIKDENKENSPRNNIQKVFYHEH